MCLRELHSVHFKYIFKHNYEPHNNTYSNLKLKMCYNFSWKIFKFLSNVFTTTGKRKQTNRMKECHRFITKLCMNEKIETFCFLSTFLEKL